MLTGADTPVLIKFNKSNTRVDFGTCWKILEGKLITLKSALFFSPTRFGTKAEAPIILLGLLSKWKNWRCGQ